MSMIIKEAQVCDILDVDAEGLRIKVRLGSDGNVNKNQLPYAFPLLPKTIQSVPKIGECALILLMDSGNDKSDRFYIGPVISQPQRMSYDPYNNGKGSATSLLQGNVLGPLPKLSQTENTEGSFPEINDIAIVGRQSEDIILKEGEVQIRSGIRSVDNTNEKTAKLSPIIYNDKNPSYIQLKKNNRMNLTPSDSESSVANIVADKVNLISNLTNDQEVSDKLHSKGKLISDEDMKPIIDRLHSVAYGDVLVDFLEVIRKAINEHVHPYPGQPPLPSSSIVSLNEINFTEIESDDIHIS